MKVLHIDKNHPSLIDGLTKLGFENHERYEATKNELASILGDYEGLVIRSRFSLDRDFLKHGENLKFIARVGAGLESIDISFAESRGIALLSAPEGNRNAVGEHALGMILSLFNNIKKADLEIRSGKWKREDNRGLELEGKTIGIIGYGNMGKAFAKKLQGFDVEVICYDIKNGVGDEHCKQVSLSELQKRAHVVSIHTPHNESSFQMVNTSFINGFENSIYLINTARGSAVVTNDLVEALINRKVIGACLDVLEYEKTSFENLFENEHLPEAFEYLTKCERVLLSPHIAGWTVESKEKLASTIVEKIGNLYHPVEQDAPEESRGKVTGIGGLFFKSPNPESLKKWYREHLGFETDQWGCTFKWKEHNGNDASTQWGPFSRDTKYFNPSDKDYMFNYRVDDLESLIDELKRKGITVVGDIESYDYGKFGWVMDPDGNKIELWEPVDSAFN